MEYDFIRQRITQLREQKGIAEYRMSMELGHSRNYIHNITNTYRFQWVLDKSVTYLRNMYKSVLMYSDIYEASEVYYISDSSL